MAGVFVFSQETKELQKGLCQTNELALSVFKSFFCGF